MPPLDYFPADHEFRDLTGRVVSRQSVRTEIDKLTYWIGRESKWLADRLNAKEISLAEFEIGMRELLKSGHIVAASIGRGGIARMTQADWGRVGAKIKWQYEFLQKFVRKIEQGRISQVLTASRAQLYSSAILTSFYGSLKADRVDDKKDAPRVRLVTNSEESCKECAADEALGFIPVDEMKEIGERKCGQYCKCDLEFEDEVS